MHAVTAHAGDLHLTALFSDRGHFNKVRTRNRLPASGVPARV